MRRRIGAGAAAGAIAAVLTIKALARDLGRRREPELAALVQSIAVVVAVLLAWLAVDWVWRRRKDSKPSGSLAREAACAVIATPLVVAADAMFVPVAPDGMWMALIGLGALGCALAAGGLGALRRLALPSARALREAPATAFAVATSVALGSATWIVIARAAFEARSWRWALPWLAALVSIVAVLVALGLARLLGRLSSRWPSLAAAFVAWGALAAAAWTPVAIGFRDLPILRLAVPVVAAVLASAVGIFASRWRLAAFAAVLTLGLIPAAWKIDARQDLRGVLLRDPPSAAVVLRTLRLLGDPDRDGYSAWLGTRDCAAFDARRHPFARERVGNGIDEDCSGADLTDWAEPPPPIAGETLPPASPPPDIVLIVVDALRARQIAPYGGREGLAPNIEKLAAGGVVFDRAYTLCPSTHRALPSMITGLRPSDLPETMVDDDQALSDERVTIFETLEERGYESNVVFQTKFMRTRNLEQGAEGVHTNPKARGNRADPARTKIAFRLIREWSEAPQFLWLHLYAPHAPHDAPYGVELREDTPLGRYEAEITYSDKYVARILRLLSKSERGQRAIVIVTADHGEEFFEHGREQHSRALYNESVRVPLIIAGAGIGPHRVATSVDHLDLAQTIAGFAGAELRGRGRDLRGSLRGSEPAPRPVILELLPLRENNIASVAVIDADRKLIVNIDDGLFEYFDLASDPHELVNLYDDRREEIADLESLARRHIEVATAIPP